MVPELVLAFCTIIEIFVILWGLSQLQKEMREITDELEESIDNKLALAIQSTGLVNNGEPVNPVQQAIAGLIQNMASQSQQPKQITVQQDAKGLFVKND